MQVADLMAGLPGARLVGDPATEVAGITADSREVRPGWLFIAYRGKERDLHDFVPAALRQGAAALVVERPVEAPAAVAQLIVSDGRAVEGLIAAAYYGHPSRRLKVIGVTGTDGKTTTSTLIHAVLEAAGHTSGLITTVNARIGEREFDTGLHTTTPRAIDVQRLLAEMAAGGAEWAVLETTSHALAQHRTVGVDYDVAVMTNVTHEHLDEHGSFEAYRDAKASLFRALANAARKPGQPKLAVLNADDASAATFGRAEADRKLTYSLDAASGADVRAIEVELAAAGSSFRVAAPGYEPLAVQSKLPGRYNVANALAAISVGVALGLPGEAIVAGISRVGAIPGRMEVIDLGQPFTAIVDFAHTPNALRSALTVARELTRGRVIAVFGCAGERDVAKRPLMGEIAAQLADVTVITDEDRRREDVEAIMEQVAEGARRAGGVEGVSYMKEPDRGTAIERAVLLARPGDVVIVCGKGHEKSMCFGTEERPWSDQAAVAAALTARS